MLLQNPYINTIVINNFLQIEILEIIRANHVNKTCNRIYSKLTIFTENFSMAQALEPSCFTIYIYILPIKL